MPKTTDPAPLDSVSAAQAKSKRPRGAAAFPLDPAKDKASAACLVHMLRVMFPHKRFADGPYQRTAKAVFAAAAKSPAQQVNFAGALHDLKESGFAKLKGEAAIKALKAIETTEFFKLARSTAVVALYDDKEVWKVLGYEGPSFDKGGYVKRGFNDLDWLPDPRIDEWEAGR